MTRDGYSPVKETANARFDETIEVAINLGIDPKQSTSRLEARFPSHGVGKKVRVLVFAQKKAREAQEAGADYVGEKSWQIKIQSGWLEFDAAVATPDMMRVVGKLGKVLGPRGLMPNAKNGNGNL